MKKIRGKIVSVNDLSAIQVDQMFCLMKDYYQNMKEEVFVKDLNEKEKVIVLLDEFDCIRGFSTIMIISHKINNEKVFAVFSGDTITDKVCRNSLELSLCFSLFLQSIIMKSASERYFWYLISKGYKTYRHLSVYFKNFYPCFDDTTPEFEKNLIEGLSRERFGKNFEKDTGLIKAGSEAVSLKCGDREAIDANMNNPHIKYFFEKNPGFVKGDELVCLTEIRRSNMTKAFFRVIKTRVEQNG